MSFAAPGFLWGLALCALPFLLHLLHKRRRQRIRWAMVWLLERAIEKRRRMMVLRDRSLLLLRLLLLVALALAFARPSLQVRASGLLASFAPTEAALLVDVSASMGARDVLGGATRLEQVMLQARALLEELDDVHTELLPFADGLLPVLASGSAGELAEGLSSGDLRLVPRDVAGDTTKSLLALARRVEDTGQPREIFLLSDLQAGGWRDFSIEAREALKRLSAAARVHLISSAAPASASLQNTAIVGLALTSGRFATPEVSARVLVELEHAGPPREVRLELRVDERVVHERLVLLAADGQVALELSAGVLDAGQHRVEARLAPDLFEADDSRALALPVLAERAVHFVDGTSLESAGAAGIGSSVFLRTFLAPRAASDGQEFLFAPRTLSLAELPAVLDGLASDKLDDLRVLVLADVPRIDSTLAEQLERWVRAGGALVIFPGPAVDVAAYAVLEGSLLPVTLGAPSGRAMGELESALDCRGIDPSSVADFLLPRSAASSGEEALLSLRVGRAFALTEVRADSGARCLARFDDAAPFLVEGRLGAGRVLLFAIGCDHRWSNLPVSPALALVDRLLRELVAPAARTTTLEVGAVPRIPCPESTLTGRLQGPRGILHELVRGDAADGAPRLTTEPLERSGFWELEAPGMQARLLATTLPIAETRFDALSAADLLADFGLRVNELENNADAPLTRPLDLARILLVIAAIAALTEALLAARKGGAA